MNSTKVITQEEAIAIARLALAESKIGIVDKSLTAAYREHKLGMEGRNKGWFISAKIDFGNSSNADVVLDPDTVAVYVSDPEGDVFIPNIL